MATPEDLVSVELQIIADELSERLEKIAGQRMNFSLLVFHTEPGTRMSYVSNANREDVKQALRSLIHGWDQGMPDIPAHKIN